MQIDRPIQSVVGRLAPSPTGAQHVGNARTYLAAWLSARRQWGHVVLRIEDVDSPRVKKGADRQAIDDLRWLGLDYDGEPVVQTARVPLYTTAVQRAGEGGGCGGAGRRGSGGGRRGGSIPGPARGPTASGLPARRTRNMRGRCI